MTDWIKIMALVIGLMGGFYSISRPIIRAVMELKYSVGVIEGALFRELKLKFPEEKEKK